MKKNLITTLIVALLGCIAGYFYFTSTRSTTKKELRDFAVQDTGSVNKIFLADMAGNKVTLTRNKPGEWMVNGKFIVRNDAINTLLYTIKVLDVREPVAKSARATHIKDLSSGGIKVEIYHGEEMIKKYYVGGQTPDGTGTYMLLADAETNENSSVPFVMYIPGFNGYLSTRYFTSELLWRDKTVFRNIPPEIRSIKMVHPPAPEKGFELLVNGPNDFTIKTHDGNPVVFDTLQVKQYLTYFRSLSFEHLFSETGGDKRTRDSVSALRPMFILSLTDTKGKTNTLKAFRKGDNTKGFVDIDGDILEYDPDRMYALINNDRDFVIIQYFLFGKVFMDIDYFRKQDKTVKK